MYKKIIQNGYIVAVGSGDFGTDITEDEYNALLEILQNRPQETAEIGYRLKTDLTWESYEKEPQPEPDLTADEIVDIIFGGVS